jgi:hypothetical protein
MQLRLYIAPSVLKKCNNKHNITEEEIREAWDRYNGPEFEDTRESNRSNPATQWFIVKIGSGRILNLAYIPFDDEGVATLRTCFVPAQPKINVFLKHGGAI